MRIRSLLRDERGAAITELGVLLLPLCILLMGLLDVGYMMYARSVLQGALNDVARAAVVENPDLVGEDGQTLEQRIAAAVEARMDGLARDAVIDTVPSHYDRFTSVGKPEKLITDRNDNGVYDAEDGDCFQDMNESGEWDDEALPAGASGIGGADDIAIYTADMSMDRLFPIDELVGALPIGIEMSPTYRLQASTAVRNQPYDIQAAPPTVCGADEEEV